ncbi:hypothetical protein WPS_18990 [Vulcanimicrobium alpinum]|uniref:YHYH domain-containing protein n=1 Tax=Vulcanimicrobium alpinum TaxID=3016050 RepID=A0AAN1XYE6_UNVUL|nr:hypothetical protein WPS_18990 [Vulcanimicrobium alpinum]
MFAFRLPLTASAFVIAVLAAGCGGSGVSHQTSPVPPTGSTVSSTAKFPIPQSKAFAVPRAPSFAVPAAPPPRDAAGSTRSTQSTPSTNPFFNGEQPLSNGVYYLQFANSNIFGYYAFLSDPHYIYHFDAGYEYVFDSTDPNAVYLYDFASGHFWYTGANQWPYVYDFTLKAELYYYPDTNNAGHYTTNPRYFYNFGTSQVITMPASSPSPSPTPSPTPIPIAATTTTLSRAYPNAGTPNVLPTFKPQLDQYGYGITIDGYTPAPNISYGFHRNVVVAIIKDGTLLQNPVGVGLVNPTVTPCAAGPGMNNPYVTNDDEAYQIHEHDYSGIWMLEPHSTTETFKLGSLFDIWGNQPIDRTHVANQTGNVRIFSYDSNAANPVATEYMGNPYDFVFGSFNGDVTIIEIGTFAPLPHFVIDPNYETFSC